MSDALHLTEAIRAELLSNVVAFQTESIAGFMGLFGSAAVPVDLATFYTSPSGKRLLMVHTASGGPSEAIKAFSERIKSSDKLPISIGPSQSLRGCIKDYAAEHGCEQDIKVNLHFAFDSDSESDDRKRLGCPTTIRGT